MTPDEIKALADAIDHRARKRSEDNWQGIVPGIFIVAIITCLLSFLGLW